MRTCMGTQRWAPWWIPAALGALYDISGAPRCPLAVVEATAALAWRRTEGWGPGQLADEQRACWEAAVGWAGAPRAALALPGPTSDLRHERAVLVEAALGALLRLDRRGAELPDHSTESFAAAQDPATPAATATAETTTQMPRQKHQQQLQWQQQLRQKQ